MSFHKILVALDDSPLGHTVFEQALSLAQTYKAALKLFHCINPELLDPQITNTFVDPGMTPSVSTGNYQTQQLLLDTQIERTRSLLTRYHQMAANNRVATESEFSVGQVGATCCEAAKAWGADLIVMGRKGHSGITEALLGSASNYVLHHAVCSVLIIQPPNAKH